MSALPQFAPTLGAQMPGTATLRSADLVAFPEASITFNEIIAALTYALDLTANGNHGHTLRCCLLGMRIAEQLRLSQAEMSDLYYALLLKDIGCSSNSAGMCQLIGMDETEAKQAARTFDWTRFEWRQLRFLLRRGFRKLPVHRRFGSVVRFLKTRSVCGRELMQMRCSAGWRMAGQLGLSAQTAEAIRCLDEHWDGRGQPQHLAGPAIPLLSQICNLAQNLEVFSHLEDRDGAVAVVKQRCGTWFDPGLVVAVVLMHESGRLWDDTPEGNLVDVVVGLAPDVPHLRTPEAIENVCEAFAEVVDAKSHYTFLHSKRVAAIAAAMGEQLGVGTAALRTLRRAALLHDIGKLGIPNTILDKTGKLSAGEWQIIRGHPVQSFEVLRRIRSFGMIARTARSHHEKLDGSGYPDALVAPQIPLLARILAVADVYDALSSARPYRTPLECEQVFGIMDAEVPESLDAECYAALKEVVRAGRLPSSAAA